MANKIKSKGSSLLVDISSTYTAIPQLIDISISGEASTTWASTVLDGPVHETHDPTGNTTAPTITANGLYDPDDTTIQNIEALILAPLERNFKVTYVDATPTSDIYAVAGVGLDKSIAVGDGVKCTYNLQTTGTPS
jgi:hypothetical protein